MRAPLALVVALVTVFVAALDIFFLVELLVRDGVGIVDRFDRRALGDAALVGRLGETLDRGDMLAVLDAHHADALRRTALDRQLLLAMTNWQLGQRDDARRLLAATQPAIDQWLQKPFVTWMRRAEIELLRREAEALIAPRQQSKLQNNDHPTPTKNLTSGP